MMKFKDKKEEFNYYALKALEALNNGERNVYLIFLKKAKEILEELEGKSIEELIDEIE